MPGGRHNHTYAEPIKSVRPYGDFYETPEEATIALLEREKFEGNILEPACGRGAISQALKDYGYEVYSNDLVYRGYGMGSNVDFLTTNYTAVNNIITNPPFKLAKEFVLKALESTDKKVAMFLRLAFLESQSRKEMFQNTPLARVYVFSKRLTLYPGDMPKEERGGSGSIAFAWFLWDHEYNGEPVLRWI
jgi:hypothetical protein